MAINKSQIKKYFLKTLAVDVLPEVWQHSRRLPLFLREGYTYYEIKILSVKCLVMADHDNNRSAANIQKHFERIREKWDDEIIYARDQVTSLDRMRLIERKIPFIVPGNQMYLPMLGIDLREHFRQIHNRINQFSPATQAVILLLLTDLEQTTYNIQKLADRLGYSKMTASRCLNELRAEKLNVVHQVSRTRLLEFDGNRQKLWKHALPLLSNPVKYRRHIRYDDRSHRERIGITAGLTALAKYSLLAPPQIPTIAVNTKQWKKIKAQLNTTPAKQTDPESIELEVWKYDPELFANENTVDRFSLFLSLKECQDERVESALNKMMEAVL